MKIQQISSDRLKKSLNVKRVRKSYENKHVNGSGNFGFVIVTKEDKWYRIDGDYDTIGNVIRIDVNSYGTTTLEDEPMIEKIREAVEKTD